MRLTPEEDDTHRTPEVQLLEYLAFTEQDDNDRAVLERILSIVEDHQAQEANR
jgi:hypothetical protein